MKRFQKTTVLFLAIVMLVMLLPGFSVSAADSDMRYGRKKLSEMTNGAALVYAYDQMVAGCTSVTPPTINLSHGTHKVSTTEFNNYVFPLFYSDYPEYFWINNGGYQYSYSSNGTILSVKPGYHSGISDLSAAKAAFESKANTLLAGLTGSDYDKAKTLHDRLIDTVTYVRASNDQNAYGALVEGKAVCNGYARAYQYLLQKAGIPAWYVRGSSTNPTTNKSEDHAWNLVKLDSQWYYTDVTWDDQGSNTFYTYFNITSAQLMKDHVLDSSLTSLVPEATATAANFYLKENRSFSSYDREKLVQFLKKDGKTTQLFITGDKDAFLSSLKGDLLNVGLALGGSGAFHISYSVSILGNSIILSVVLLEENHAHQVKTTVAQIDASCLANGTKGYFLCDCGYKFLDSACTQQVQNDSELVIAALSHTQSDWQSDGLSHWKKCTSCGSETVNTRADHSDGNADHKCDTCGYNLPVADENGNVTVENTPSEENEPGTPTEENTQNAPTESGATQPAGENNSQTTPENNQAASEPADTAQPSGDKKSTPVIVGALLGCCIIGSSIGAIIWWQKKKSVISDTPADTDNT